VDSAQTLGDYFFHFFESSSIFKGKVFARKAANGNITFGIAKQNNASYTGVVWTDSTYTAGTTYLLVSKYTFVAGATNDTAYLWVNPTLGGSEPAAQLTGNDPTTADADSISGVALRQGTAAQAPYVKVGAIRMGTSWASVTTGTVDNVTFKVRMNIKMLKGAFNPATDSVWVAGNFNGWGAKGTLLTYSGSDSSASRQVPIDSIMGTNDTIFYKFTDVHAGTLNWEGDPNRVYRLVSGSHVLPTVYFDRDSVYTPSVNVTFKVNMAIVWKEGRFRPDLGDVVTVPGDINGWNTSTDTLKKLGSDSVFTAVKSISQGTTIHYKFFKTSRGGVDWESDQATSSHNREYTVPVGGGTIAPTPWFNNDSVYVATVTTNVTFTTDMSAFITIGWFNPLKDTVEARGGFNGWGGSAHATPDPIVDTRWFYSANGQILLIGDNVPYKFYMRMDSATAVGRFPGLIPGNGGNSDSWYYEHPAAVGDGNRLFSVANQANQSAPMQWFSDINPRGLLKNTTDSVNVTLKVNMGPATRYSVPFNPATDTVYLDWQDAIWRSGQIKNQGAFPQYWKMTRQSGTDSVYTVTFKVKGKTHYGLLYTYQIRRSDGSTEDQGAGLGAQHGYTSRFIQATSPNVWPASYTAPTDVWTKNPPLPGETPQYATGNETTPPTVPGSFALYQNYPNPFNPTTYIRYTVPQQTHVRLQVYNLLGQEIAELVNTVQPAGTHIVAFDAHRLATGVYFYKLETGSFSDIKKMILLK